MESKSNNKDLKFPTIKNNFSSKNTYSYSNIEDGRKNKELFDLKEKVLFLEKENLNLKNKLKTAEGVIIEKNKLINELERKIKENKLNSSNINTKTQVNSSNNLYNPLYFHSEYENPHEEEAIIQSLIEYHQINDPIKEYEDQLIREICPDPDHMTYDQILELEDKIGVVSRGLKKETINKIPIRKYKERQYKDNKCVICMSTFEINEDIRLLGCQHIFHKDCIDGWLIKEKVCPVCKQEIIPKN